MVRMLLGSKLRITSVGSWLKKNHLVQCVTQWHLAQHFNEIYNPIFHKGDRARWQFNHDLIVTGFWNFTAFF